MVVPYQVTALSTTSARRYFDWKKVNIPVWINRDNKITKQPNEKRSLFEKEHNPHVSKAGGNSPYSAHFSHDDWHTAPHSAAGPTFQQSITFLLAPHVNSAFQTACFEMFETR